MMLYGLSSPEEMMARLALSDWNRRAWTLQEALVAGDKKLMIVMKGGIFSCFQARLDLGIKKHGTDEEFVINHGVYAFGSGQENPRDHAILSTLVKIFERGGDISGFGEGVPRAKTTRR